MKGTDLLVEKAGALLCPNSVQSLLRYRMESITVIAIILSRSSVQIPVVCKYTLVLEPTLRYLLAERITGTANVE